MRPVVEKAMSGEELGPKEAYDAMTMLPDQKSAAFWDGHLITTGTRMRWGKRLLAAMVDVWAYAENSPDHAPNLWEDIAYREGYRIAPDAFTATNAAAMDECLWFGDKLYRSKMAGNTFTPEIAPNVWEVVE